MMEAQLVALRAEEEERVAMLVDPSLGPPQIASRALVDLARDSPDVQVSAIDDTSDEP